MMTVDLSHYLINSNRVLVSPYLIDHYLVCIWLPAASYRLLNVQILYYCLWNRNLV